ncbi:YHYH protein [uncultured Maribacter sp.]|uniref:YHYH protein n=1 Tax=uncultured Maribacter sp. TaxID=431308 RepID=UPI00261D760F|nr:YHYH protein [uncultured Maribacter sp.]
MKKITYFFVLLTLVFSCSNDESDRSDELETLNPTAYNTQPLLTKFSGTGLSYEINGNSVIFTTQDLPDHTSPYWDTANALYEEYNGTNPDWNQNPGSIGAQNIVFTISLKPSEAVNKETTSLGPIGIARNGVVFFNQYAAGNNPLTGEINSFDQWLGHPAMTTYHYHVEPTWLTQEFGEDAFLGLLSDGFPIYGPMENGETVTNADLDAYHGHTGVTEDFPDGIYHYHITNEDPYLNGNGYFGTPGNISR